MSIVRAAAVSEIPRLRAIEVAAGRIFADVGMPEIAGDDAPAPEVFARHIRAGRAWVVADDAAAPALGFLLASIVDDAAHIDQVSVDPSAAHRGLGRRLIDHVGAWAAARGLGAVTLTTFRDVPWNGPYYTRLGFRELDLDELGAELRAVRLRETDLGLDPASRICMARPTG